MIGHPHPPNRGPWYVLCILYTIVNFSCCSQGVLRTVDAPSLLFRLNRALELIRCCEKELCEIQTGSGAGSEGAPSGSDSPGETRWIRTR